MGRKRTSRVRRRYRNDGEIRPTARLQDLSSAARDHEQLPRPAGGLQRNRSEEPCWSVEQAALPTPDRDAGINKIGG